MSLTFALQNLLIRHEEYIAGAEEECRQMAASIEKLEVNKKGLEVANAQMVEENRNLLNDLEELNNNLSNSDAHIRSLTSTLESTRNELERLNVLAARSSQFEAQLLEMETEQSRLQSQLMFSELDCRSATQRWKTAERTIAHLQEQLDRMEEEAREEREKHEEIVSQLERRRLVERELENAAGRLKGAAAVTTLGRNQGKNNVVSHFVRDILQDNANLQMGIVELREMLVSSNEEVEALREQMLVHQPSFPSIEHGVAQARLQSELALSAAKEAKPELHIYHHYQPAGRLVRQKSQGLRRPRSKRNFTNPDHLTPRSGFRSPRTPSAHSTWKTPAAKAGPKLPPTIASSRSSLVHRWSTHSSLTQNSMAPSTVPSSPQSIHQNPSIFDTLDTTIEFSRPTSPESTSAGSPRFSYRHRRTTSDASFTSLSKPLFSEPNYSVSKSITLRPPDEAIPEIPDAPLDSINIPKATNNDLPMNPPPPKQPSNPPTNKELYHPNLPLRPPRLHRSASHESILSISSPPFKQQQPPSHLFNPAILPSRAVLTQTPATALPTLRQSSSNYNRSLLSNLHLRVPPSTTTSTSLKDNPKPHPQTLGKRVGGWVLGKWAGVVPIASIGDLRTAHTAAAAAAAAAAQLDDSGGGGDMMSRAQNQKTKLDVVVAAPRVRATGVNQKGVIGGLGSMETIKGKKGRADVVIGVIDEGLLRESLGEG